MNEQSSAKGRWLWAVITILFAGSPLVMNGAEAEGKRPNIIFVYADDHAYQAIQSYGGWLSEYAPTPNIDRLASEGMLFRECYVSNSICGPMRSVVQTGKYSHLNGFYRNGQRFDTSQQTFPKLLQEAGYQTAIVGKWHLKAEPVGYDYYHVLYGQGPYYNPAMRTPDGRVEHTGYTTDVITDEALKWLKSKRDQDEPFMLMYQHKAPHRNWQPGPEQLSLYDDVTLPEPATLFDDYAGRAGPVKNQKMMIAKHMNKGDLKLRVPGDLNETQRYPWNAAYRPKNEAFRQQNLEGKELVRWKYQRYLKDYLRCIASIDANLGRLLGYLKKSGLAENTVVVYSSDQGFYLGEHGWFDKRWIYEESLRTPLVVRWPGVTEPGSENSQIVSPVDFAPTFLQMAGAEVPSDMQGRSLVPLLQGKRPNDWRESFYYHYYEYPGAHSVRRHYGVVTDRYKLVHFYREGEWELLDLKANPKETKNYYGEAKYQEVQERLKTELKRLQKDLKVPADQTKLY